MNVEKHKSTVLLSIAIGFFQLFLNSIAAHIIKSASIQGSLLEKSFDYLVVAMSLGTQLIGGITALYFYFYYKK